MLGLELELGLEVEFYVWDAEVERLYLIDGLVGLLEERQFRSEACSLLLEFRLDLPFDLGLGLEGARLGLLYALLELGFGAEVTELFTPCLELGGAEVTAYATLGWSEFRTRPTHADRRDQARANALRRLELEG